MRTIPRSRHLLRLQDSLMARAAEPARGQPMVLPFLVGTRVFALPYAEVARVTLPSCIVQVPPAPQVPGFVVGIAACESDLLTVVDFGRLLGAAPVEQTIKTRLIVMADGPMKGFALLVTRVHDLAPSQEVEQGPGVQATSAADLASRIQARTSAPERHE